MLKPVSRKGKRMYFVVNKETQRHMSLEPLSYKDAMAQMRALYVHVKDAK